MPLSVGTRLGPYEILAPIGAGGMGEVYRARDTKLKRDIALKILPEAFSSDLERMARFEREAQVLASLNHPNIAQIYGVEDRALVMELVEGHTLNGPLPLETALGYARQIAEALEAAHEKGIVHRDLKPANVKVTPDGIVKVLDFGLAKAADASAGNSDPANSPTLTISPTRAGMILGTAAYMSPEQAHGKEADRRSDIWSFGALLFELMTGKKAFAGESVPDTLASVLKLEPDWNALPPDTPPQIRKLLSQCLRKDRRQRLQAIGDARIALEEALNEKPAEHSFPPAVNRLAYRRLLVAWLVAAGIAIVAGVALWGWLRPRPPTPRNVVRLTTSLPLATVPGALALSRDGSLLAFVGGPQQQIYIRPIDQLEFRPLPGTDLASFLCFSPDGQWITYVGGPRPVQQLKKIAIAGGPSQTLATVLAVNGPPTQSWAQDDNIYFSNNGVLMRIPSEGGQPETLATPEVSKGEMYFAAPQLLPGGGELLVTITSVGNHSRLLTLDLQTHRTKMLLENVEIGQYVGSGPASGAGHLLYYDRRSASLMAVPFNPRRYAVKGAPAPIIEGVQRYDGSSIALLAISDSGTLAYLPGAAGPGTESRLVWVDRKGTEQPLPAAARGYNWVRLSPDGHRIAVSIHEETEDVWVYDIARGALTRITSEGHSGGPIWSPDGQRLIFERRPPGGAAVMSVPSDGSSSPSILAKHNKGPIAPSSLSPDGKVLVGFYPFEVGLWALPLPAGNAKQTPQSLFESEFKKGYPQFSPDGRWIAFTSDESGRAEIYVAPYPGPGGKIQISIDGGAYPRWARNGRELFYRDGEQMMAVEAQSGSSSFRVAAPHTLFHALYGSYDVALDGQRFLMIKPPADTTRQGNQVIVVLNWFEELRRRIPLGRE